MILKANNRGREIQGLPTRAVLEDDALPGEITDAVASWRESLAVLADAGAAHREAEAAARETTLQVRGERARWLAEIGQKTREEADALKAAERGSTAAANDVVAALQEHADSVRMIGARLALEAHVEAVDAWLTMRAARGRFRAAAPAVPRSHLAGLEAPSPPAPARGAGHVLAGLEDLDLVNVPALLEILDAAPEDFGLVEVRHADGAVLVTTPRRAESLVGNGSTRWSLVEEVTA